MSSLAAERAAVTATALDKAAQEVLGAAWGCVPESAPQGSPLAASGQGSVLPLCIAGQRCELQLHVAAGAVGALLPRLLGRVVTAEEVDSLGDELVGELLNQVAGRLAGLLGAQGVQVDLGTPAPPKVPSLPLGSPNVVQGSSARLAAVPASLAMVPAAVLPRWWRCTGHLLVLTLSPAVASAA